MRVMATANGSPQCASDANKITEPPRNSGFAPCKIAPISDNFVSVTSVTQAIIKDTRSYVSLVVRIGTDHFLRSKTRHKSEYMTAKNNKKVIKATGDSKSTTVTVTYRLVLLRYH